MSRFKKPGFLKVFERADEKDDCPLLHLSSAGFDCPHVPYEPPRCGDKFVANDGHAEPEVVNESSQAPESSPQPVPLSPTSKLPSSTDDDDSPQKPSSPKRRLRQMMDATNPLSLRNIKLEGVITTPSKERKTSTVGGADPQSLPDPVNLCKTGTDAVSKTHIGDLPTKPVASLSAASNNMRRSGNVTASSAMRFLGGGRRSSKHAAKKSSETTPGKEGHANPTEPGSTEIAEAPKKLALHACTSLVAADDHQSAFAQFVLTEQPTDDEVHATNAEFDVLHATATAACDSDDDDDSSGMDEASDIESVVPAEAEHAPSTIASPYKTSDGAAVPSLKIGSLKLPKKADRTSLDSPDSAHVTVSDDAMSQAAAASNDGKANSEHMRPDAEPHEAFKRKNGKKSIKAEVLSALGVDKKALKLKRAAKALQTGEAAATKVDNNATGQESVQRAVNDDTDHMANEAQDTKCISGESGPASSDACVAVRPPATEQTPSEDLHSTSESATAASVARSVAEGAQVTSLETKGKKSSTKDKEKLERLNSKDKYRSIKKANSSTEKKLEKLRRLAEAGPIPSTSSSNYEDKESSKPRRKIAVKVSRHHSMSLKPGAPPTVFCWERVPASRVVTQRRPSLHRASSNCSRGSHSSAGGVARRRLSKSPATRSKARLSLGSASPGLAGGESLTVSKQLALAYAAPDLSSGKNGNSDADNNSVSHADLVKMYDMETLSAHKKNLEDFDVDVNEIPFSSVFDLINDRSSAAAPSPHDTPKSSPAPTIAMHHSAMHFSMASLEAGDVDVDDPEADEEGAIDDEFSRIQFELAESRLRLGAARIDVTRREGEVALLQRQLEEVRQRKETVTEERLQRSKDSVESAECTNTEDEQ